MIILRCPWCETDAPIDPAVLEQTGTFTCDECLTVVRLVENDALVLDLAA